MPPKKKSSISNATSPPPPTSTTKSQSIAEETPGDTEADEEATQAAFDAQILSDPWTDEEEIGLFKGLIKWKPTGIHKHFHLLSLQQYLLTNGYIHPGAPHTRLPHIWAKLRSLYDLDALDEREMAHAVPWSPSQDDDADELGGEGGDEGDDEQVPEFELPQEEFGELMWRQRFPTAEDEAEREESPADDDELVARADSPPVRFTPSFEIAASEGKPTPSRKGKGGAAASAKAKVKGRVSAMAANATARRSSRVADSVDPEEEEEDDEEGEESGEESGAASTASGTPAPRARARPTARNKPTKARAKRRR
ncbi:chromatin modification-related protein EAF7-domain-containing protein [Delphinella strobiligena]|nr:chromatin modification-related protein EAF7-domain-containing protein [Delphinella strobiligena]